MKNQIFLGIITMGILTFVFTYYSIDPIEAAIIESVWHDSEEGSIEIDQSQYLKPKYVHEPVQLHISGKINDYQRAESTLLTIKSPSGDIIENVIRPTREGGFDCISQITSNHSSGQYEIRIIHKEMIIGPAVFKVVLETENELKTQNIPEWVRNNAGWWSKGLIGNNDFVEGIQYLVNKNIIKVPPTSIGTQTGSNEIPEWVKNNAGWWSEELIGTSEFVKGIQFLVEQRIIKVV